MSFNYLAHFGFELPLTELRPEDQRHGSGTCPITVDKEPETAEEYKEIARTIGKQGGYSRVAITFLQPTVELVTDAGTILDWMAKPHAE